MSFIMKVDEHSYLRSASVAGVIECLQSTAHPKILSHFPEH